MRYFTIKNKTNHNKTECSENNLIHLSRDVQAVDPDQTDEIDRTTHALKTRKQYEEYFQERLEVDDLKTTHPHEQGRIDEIVAACVDIMCSKAKTFRVNSEPIPAEIVKKKIMKLDSGLIDFGLVFGEVDEKKYNTMRIPVRERWDDPLAEKETIAPEDLRGKPLIISMQENAKKQLADRMHARPDRLHAAAAYNLILNDALLSDGKFGYTIGCDKLLDTVMEEGTSTLRFRQMEPVMEAEAVIVWKKYQIFSRAADLFLQQLQKQLCPEEKNV